MSKVSKQELETTLLDNLLQKGLNRAYKRWQKMTPEERKRKMIEDYKAARIFDSPEREA